VSQCITTGPIAINHLPSPRVVAALNAGVQSFERLWFKQSTLTARSCFLPRGVFREVKDAAVHSPGRCARGGIVGVQVSR